MSNNKIEEIKLPRHPNHKPHLILNSHGIRGYKNPQTGASPPTPLRNRTAHGGHIKNLYQQALKKAEEKITDNFFGVSSVNERGYYLDFKLTEDLNALKSLDASGLELIRIREETRGDNNHIIATVFIPKDKTDGFGEKIRKYLEENNTSQEGKPTSPKNKSLIEGIDDIDASDIKSLWCDPEDNFPKNDRSFLWEVCILSSQETEFIQACQKEEINIQPEERLKFPDRIMFCINTNVKKMQKIQLRTGAIAELRGLKPIAGFLSSLQTKEQAEWMEDLRSRIEWPNIDAPSICLLDSGVNHAHPLLTEALKDQDLHTYDPNWPKADGFNPDGNHDQYHGTAMAGIALYGDLGSALESQQDIQLKHRLESVRILPRRGENPKKLYGYIAKESVARVEIQEPNRLRNFCMAITSSEDVKRGKPSSWSAEIDNLCAGTNDDDPDKKRLIIISAGNIRDDNGPPQNYFSHCQIEQIENPAQSWNALTVGAYTEKININDDDFQGWQALAEEGDLSPWSRTSVTWQEQWPIKPEIVLEGGNKAISPNGQSLDSPDDLCLLTTHYEPATKLFQTVDGTSPATAQAARMAAIIQEQYQNFWPETIRALLVHSAGWTPKMLDRIKLKPSRKHMASMMQCFGYGVPSLERALWSAQNALTLVAQNTIQPFKRASDKKEGTMNEMHLFELPWPKATLESLAEEEVLMKITLSYFVEPNPSERGYKTPYAYSSHGLRFEIKQPSETLDNFKRRINKSEREDEQEKSPGKPESDKWYIVKRARDHGSVHSDIWKGTGAELAAMGIVAVYPTSGWWKTHIRQEKWNTKTRYSLIISIETDNEKIDLYTPVATLIEQEITI